MQCYSCKGKLHKGETTYTITRKSYHLIIDHVPAWVCEQCGEVLFDEAQVKVIQQLIEDADVGVSALVPASV
jgi:YgiT-type zinc finger domain-containing protein